ncbi:MAG TPA: DinB family protein, partial [Acidimicrobiales bacterium]
GVHHSSGPARDSREHAAMDLRAWIRAEHASVATRLDQAVVAHVPPERWKERADGGGASIAWLLFHMAWHQDLAVSVALRGEGPMLAGRRVELGLEGVEVWAGLGEAEQVEVTERLDIVALRTYAEAVHQSTQGWLAIADLAVLDDVPDSSPRITELAGVTTTAVPWLHSMWRDKPGAFFVQWEATGHPLSHLGEMISVRGRLGLSPF